MYTTDFRFYEDLTYEKAVQIKLVRLSSLYAAYSETLADYDVQFQFIHDFFDKLFEKIFDDLQNKLQKLTHISYKPVIEKYDYSYNKKIEELKLDLFRFYQQKNKELEEYFTNYKSDLEQVTQWNSRRISQIAQSLNSFIGSVKTIENSIVEASSTLSRIYKTRMDDCDNENEANINKMNEDHEKQMEEISNHFKNNLINVMENKSDLEAPFKRKPLSSLKAEITILKDEKANIVKKYYDIITSYNSYKRFPKRVLNELLSMMNLSKDENIKQIIDEIKEDLFSISSLYIRKLHQQQIFQESEYDIYTDLLKLRHELYQDLCLLYKRREDIDDMPRFTKMKADAIAKETEKIKEQLDDEYNEFVEKQKEKIANAEDEMKREIEVLERKLERERRDAVQSVVIGDDFTIEILQKEYEKLSNEYQMLCNENSHEHSDSAYDDIEIEGLELIRSILMARKLKNEAIKLKNSIPLQNDDLEKVLLEAKIDQQNQININQKHAYEEFLKEKANEKLEWVQKMKNHLEEFQQITNKTYQKINENFEFEKKKLLKLHKINKINLFRGDKRINHSLQKLKFTKSKAKISSEQYIKFLESQISTQLPPIYSQRPRKPENQLQQILDSMISK